MKDGPQAGLSLIDELTDDLNEYHLMHAARADLLRRQGLNLDSAESYRKALALVTNESERRFLQKRLREVELQGNEFQSQSSSSFSLLRSLSYNLKLAL